MSAGLQGPSRFGGLIFTYHLLGQNPTVSLERDLEYIELMDRLGFQEAFVGEHHSSGMEIIAAPEVFLSSAAQRTKRIRLGTGVISVPYHNPYTVAGRLALLDHLSHGRAIAGLGPGQLPSDSHMLALDPLKQREQLAEGADVIVRLLRGETVSAKTDWFELRDARLHLRPYSFPEMEVVIASAISPSGPVTAGRLGAGMINFAAASPPGFEALRNHWAICEGEATRHGKTVSRESWRLMSLMHLAETEEQAIRDVEHGLEKIWSWVGQIGPLGPSTTQSTAELVRELNGMAAMIGTPEMAVRKIRELADQSGGFGCFLMGMGDFADHERTLKSIDLFATHVIPEFRGQLASLRGSQEWVLSVRGEGDQGRTKWGEQAQSAVTKAISDYELERASRTAQPTESETPQQ
jgi:limonene 1,2-monooxygenase